MPTDTPPFSGSDIQRMTSVSEAEVLAEIQKMNPLLVEAAFTRLQNQKMQQVINQLLPPGESEDDFRERGPADDED